MFSPLERQISSQSSVPGADEHKLQELIRLGSHFWPKASSPAQARELLRDYLQSLEKYRVAELEHICREWREDVSRKSFPKVAELMQLLDRRRREITDAAAARERPKTLSRPLMWWHRPKSRWTFGWLESDVPAGQLIRDEEGGPLREPER